MVHLAMRGTKREGTEGPRSLGAHLSPPSRRTPDPPALLTAGTGPLLLVGVPPSHPLGAQPLFHTLWGGHSPRASPGIPRCHSPGSPRRVQELSARHPSRGPRSFPVLYGSAEQLCCSPGILKRFNYILTLRAVLLSQFLLCN